MHVLFSVRNPNLSRVDDAHAHVVYGTDFGIGGEESRKEKKTDYNEATLLHSLADWWLVGWWCLLEWIMAT